MFEPQLPETESAVAGPQHFGPAESRESQLWLGAAVFAALPLLKLWQLTRDPDALVSAIALIAALTWWLGNMLAQRPPEAGRPARVIAVAGLAGWSWLLGGLWPADFWFVRWAFLLGGLLVTVLLWGWRGPLLGVRLILALALWFVVSPASQWERLSSVWLCNRTAAAAAFMLWQAGWHTTRAGMMIYLEHGAVEVQPACTAAPLWALLMQMLIVAALLFRVSWRRVGLFAVLLALASFGISSLRVAVMAMVMVKAPAHFGYWHGAEGASWFTAAGMLLLAALVKRSLDTAAPRAHTATTVNFASDHARFIRWSAALPLAGVVLAFASAEKAAPAVPPAAPAPPGYRIIVDEIQRADDHPENWGRPFLWMHRVIYASPIAGAQIEARLAYAPNLLSGDPTVAPLGYGWLPDRRGEGVAVAHGPAGEPVRKVQEPARVAWLATLPLAGGSVAAQTDWEQQVAERSRHADAWLDWLSGQAPLHDKRAHWLAVTWRGSGDEGVTDAAALFAAWREVARANARSL